MDFVTAGCVALASAAAGFVWGRLTAQPDPADRPAPPPVVPIGGALYGRPSVAPPAPGGLTWRQINAARQARAKAVRRG